MIDKSINDIFDIYNTSSNGLDENEALIRLNKYGYNKLNTQKELNHFLVFLKQLIDPLVYVLLAAFILSILLKEYSDAIIIIFVVLVNSIISSIQEIKANKAVKSLNKLTVFKSVVIRDNIIKEIDASQLVIGDVVLLKQGDIVPADIRLINSKHLSVDESLLTGESISVDKDESLILDINTSLAEQKNMLFMSTSIVKGSAKGIVVATSMNTQIGKIASLMKNEKKQTTPLQKKLNEISKILAITTLILCGLIFTIEIKYILSSNDVILSKAQTYAFSTLALSQLFHSIGIKDIKTSIFNRKTFNNKLLIISLIFGISIQLLVCMVPIISNLFKTSLLTINEFIIMLLFSIIPLFIHEILIIFKRK